VDDADIAQIRIEKEEAARNARLIPETPYTIPRGVEGDCELCGEWFGRLVNGVCVPCRDKHKLD